MNLKFLLLTRGFVRCSPEVFYKRLEKGVDLASKNRSLTEPLVNQQVGCGKSPCWLAGEIIKLNGNLKNGYAKVYQEVTGLS